MKLNIEKTGVVVVDVQGDFTEIKNGSLAVAGTNQDYVDNVQKATLALKAKGLKLFATQDFHPKDHVSFFTNHKDKAVLDAVRIDDRTQILWPPHCVMGTPNAQILLDNTLFESIVKKGCDPKFDSYSGFFDDGGAATGLDKLLKFHHLDTLIIYGLATDYCVKATAMDARKSGFKVVLIDDLCNGVAEDTTKAALKEMARADIQIVFSADLF